MNSRALEGAKRRRSRWGDGLTGKTFPCANCGKSMYATPSHIALGKKFCQRSCQHEWRGKPERFWERVDQSAGPDACWPFQGCRDKWGYAQFGKKSKRYQAHRVAYAYAKGEIPAGKLVMHSCDNPPCCNPLHLSLGTDADNVWDKCVKGRNPDATLTPDEVRDIRERCKTPYRGLIKALGEQYNLNGSTIIKIRDRQTYRYVE